MKTIYNFLSEEDRKKIFSAIEGLTSGKPYTDDIRLLGALNKIISTRDIRPRMFDLSFYNEKIKELKPKLQANTKIVSKLKNSISGSSRSKDERLRAKITYIEEKLIETDTKELNVYEYHRGFLFDLGLSEKSINNFHRRIIEDALKPASVFFPEIAAFVIHKNRWCIATGAFSEIRL